jgi:hypothetical protein
MQIAGQKQNASGSFRRWAAYLAIAADASTAFFSWLCDRFAVRAVRSARLNRALEPPERDRVGTQMFHPVAEGRSNKRLHADASAACLSCLCVRVG